MWITNAEYAGVFLVMANANPEVGYKVTGCSRSEVLNGVAGYNMLYRRT